jgi:hypothetical protein
VSTHDRERSRGHGNRVQDGHDLRSGVTACSPPPLVSHLPARNRASKRSSTHETWRAQAIPAEKQPELARKARWAGTPNPMHITPGSHRAHRGHHSAAVCTCNREIGEQPSPLTSGRVPAAPESRALRAAQSSRAKSP